MGSTKILVVHGNDKNFGILIEKLVKLNGKAGPFSHIFVLGDVQQNTIQEAELDKLPTLYIFGTNIDSIRSEKVITFSGAGLYQCVDNLRIGFVTSNAKQLIESKEEVLNVFNKLDDTIDILISQEWSSKISNITSMSNKVFGNEVLDDIVKSCQPRYHFAYGDETNFYESDPFTWDDLDRSSRFINIPDLDSKNKWAYAFNLNLDSDSNENEKSKATFIDNPYKKDSKKRSLPDKSTIDNVEEENKSKSSKVRKILPSNCHFCFTNSNFEDHMIISIGKSSYLTIVKGPLTVPRGDMHFSGHCLLIPIEHIPKLNIGQEEFEESDLVKEMVAYESSIVKMNYRKFDMSTVVFEINSERSIHFHKQIMPVPKYLIMKFQASLDRQLHINNEKFSNNTKLDFKIYESTDEEYLGIRNDPKTNYLQFTIYETSESSPKIYLATFNAETRLDLQFGRRVVAFLLRLPKRIKWDSPLCLQSKEQETKEAECFQKSYKEFDFMKQK